MVTIQKIIAGFVLISVALVPLSGGADAATKHAVANITLSSSQVEMNTPLTISACVAQLKAPAVIDLQESEGSGHIWHTVYSRHVRSGRTCISKVFDLTSFGPAPFRLVGYSRRTLVAKSTTSVVTVFGPVPVAIFLKRIGSGGWDSAGTVITTGHTYATAGDMYDFGGGDPWTANARTTCRSVTLTMLMSANDINQLDEGTTTLSIQQNSLNEQTTLAFPDEQPFTYTFNLDGSISTWIYEDNGTNPSGLYFLGGTTADCSTPTGG